MFIVVMQIGGGFYNTWSVSDEDNSPLVFDTFEEAVMELAEFYKDHREDLGEPDEFRIIEVDYRYSHWHEFKEQR